MFQNIAWQNMQGVVGFLKIDLLQIDERIFWVKNFRKSVGI